MSGGLGLVKLVGEDVSEDSVVAAALSVLRSEERRVGKECRL